MNLTILMPDLLPSRDEDLQFEALQFLAPMKKLKTRKMLPQNNMNYQDWLWANTQSSIANPKAALMALGLGLCDSDDQRLWAKVDLVQLTADFNQVIMLGNQHYQITKDTVTKIQAALSEFFASYGLSYFPQTDDGLLVLPVDKYFSAPAPAEVSGQAIHAYLPTGDSRTFWLSLINEAQMLLQQFQPILGNIASIPANSIWLSGQSKLPSVKSRRKEIIYADDAYSIGYAKLWQIQHASLAFDYLIKRDNKNSIFIIDNSLSEIAYRDKQQWRLLMQEKIKQYLEPLQNKQLLKQYQNIIVYPNFDCAYIIKRSWLPF